MKANAPQTARTLHARVLAAIDAAEQERGESGDQQIFAAHREIAAYFLALAADAVENEDRYFGAYAAVRWVVQCILKGYGKETENGPGEVLRRGL